MIFIAYFTIVIVLLFIIYYVSTRKSANDYYNNSIGTFDENAQAALNMVTGNTDPDSRVLHARILTNNVLHDDVLRTQVPHNVILNEAAGDYYFVLNEILGGTYEAPPGVMYNIGDFNNIYHPAGDFNDIFMHADETVTQNNVAKRKEIANTETTKEGAIDRFFTESVQYTNNVQNVHDSGVTSDLNKTFNRLRSYCNNINPGAALDEAQKYINTVYASDPNNRSKCNDALKTLDMVSKANFISTYNDNELNIFASVWERSKHRDNKENSDVIKEAIVDALASSVENNSLVCIGGRTARMLNSLATIDNDAVISSAAMTQEAYRNQIFTETREIISREIETAKNSTDEDMSNVGKLYGGENVEIKDDAEKLFVDNIKKEIDMNLVQYNNKLRPEELTKIRNECYAGIEF